MKSEGGKNVLTCQGWKKMTDHEREDIMFLLLNTTPARDSFAYYLLQHRTMSFFPIPLPLSSGKTDWLFCRMLVMRSPFPTLLFDLTQQHRLDQKEALKGKYHGAGMPYFPDG